MCASSFQLSQASKDQKKLRIFENVAKVSLKEQQT